MLAEFFDHVGGQWIARCRFRRRWNQLPPIMPTASKLHVMMDAGSGQERWRNRQLGEDRRKQPPWHGA